MENGRDDNSGLLRTDESHTNTHKTPLTKIPDNNGVSAHTPLDAPRISLPQEAGEDAPDAPRPLDEEKAMMPGQDDVEMLDYPNDSSTIPPASSLRPEIGPEKRLGRPPKKSRELLFQIQQELAMDKARKENTEEGAKETEEVEEVKKPSPPTVDTTWVPKSPVLRLVSCSTSSGEDITCENPGPEEVGPRLSSPEAQQQQRVEPFDPSELDSWLERQAQPDSDLQFTPQELMETQIWGHIDPQVVWPKEHSTEWLDQKREEIEARGGRKANFGKLLTQQVIKERKEKGWGIHQNKNVTDNEKSEDAARALQELFGVEDIDDLEPGVGGG